MSSGVTATSTCPRKSFWLAVFAMMVAYALTVGNQRCTASINLSVVRLPL
jgi:hypothetical protein